MTTQEKTDHANAAYEAVKSPGVREVMEEFAGNMGFELRGLPQYGLNKIAGTVATIARAQALGIPLDDLRLTEDERDAVQLDIVKAVVGKREA